MVNVRELFKAAADETRLRLLNLLLHYELNVNEIVDIFEMGQSRISRHLKILSDCGILQHRRDGLWVFYKVANLGSGSRFIKSVEHLIRNDISLDQDLKEHEEKIKEILKRREVFFDEMAPRLDIVKDEIFGNVEIENIISETLEPSRVFADLGCGNGELLAVVASKMDWMIGVDRSKIMLEESQRKFKELKIVAELRIGEIESLPIEDNEIDSALISMVLHHLESPELALLEAARVVKKDGKLLVVELDKHSNEVVRNKFGHRWLGFEQSELVSWLWSAGFKLEKVTDLPLSLELNAKFYHTVKV